MTAIVGDVLVHHSPHSLDWVKMQTLESVRKHLRVLDDGHIEHERGALADCAGRPQETAALRLNRCPSGSPR